MSVKCPVCKEPDLVMAERQGVEIDYCPKCRGVWLDRGELDKIIERSAPQQRTQPFDSRDENREREQDNEGPSRKRSWLSDLFD
jgi:Zn-finger nucleic acid-binding protein